MSTIQIAQRLVRTFGQGENLRKVVTETIGEGKTLTKVLDNKGNLLTERLKVINRGEVVGDKFVNTITKVEQKSGDSPTKKVTERVYNSEGENIGQRIRNWFDNILDWKFVKTKGAKLETEYRINKDNNTRRSLRKNCGFLYCNGKGLPIPYAKQKGVLTNEVLNNGSLKDIRKAFQTEYPGSTYAPKEFSFSSLDEHLPDMRLTNLDQYL